VCDNYHEKSKIKRQNRVKIDYKRMERYIKKVLLRDL
jgi:hypothetical protein